MAHMQQFQKIVPSPFFEIARQATVDALMLYPQRMEMHDLLCYIELLGADGLPRENFESVLDKLRRALPQSVALDPQEWDGYGLQPIAAVNSPGSPLSGVIDPALIAANLDFVIDRQKADGGWSPNWSWDFVDAAAWAEAKREWRGVLTLKHLNTLRAYGRIEGVAAADNR
jgi:hypothetical protein